MTKIPVLKKAQAKGKSKDAIENRQKENNSKTHVEKESIITIEKKEAIEEKVLGSIVHIEEIVTQVCLINSL